MNEPAFGCVNVVCQSTAAKQAVRTRRQRGAAGIKLTSSFACASLCPKKQRASQLSGASACKRAPCMRSSSQCLAQISHPQDATALRLHAPRRPAFSFSQACSEKGRAIRAVPPRFLPPVHRKKRWSKASKIEQGHIVDTNPATGAVIQRVRVSTPSEIDAAVAAARTAQPSWNARPLHERTELVKKACAALAGKRQQLAKLDHRRWARRCRKPRGGRRPCRTYAIDAPLLDGVNPTCCAHRSTTT